MKDYKPRSDHAPASDFWSGADGHKHIWETSFETYERVCTVCSHIFKDMDTYLCQVCDSIPIESVLDVGTGLKGVVGSHFWLKRKQIKEGWGCDIWKLKEMEFWKPLKMDALDLDSVFKPNSVDVVQSFGFLEHLKKKDGLRFLEIAERIARKAVVLSAATMLHGPTADYKVIRDGNPYHYYLSSWQWEEFEDLGYESNLEDVGRKLTFNSEAFGWKVL